MDEGKQKEPFIHADDYLIPCGCLVTIFAIIALVVGGGPVARLLLKLLRP